jgi:hypothetical protein
MVLICIKTFNSPTLSPAAIEIILAKTFAMLVRTLALDRDDVSKCIIKFSTTA